MDDGAKVALQRVAYLFFYTELSNRSVQTKRTFLRRVWDHIERRMEINAKNAIEDAVDLTEMGIDAEWNGDSKTPTEALAQVREDLLEIWKQALVLGRASALVDMICRGECELSEPVLLGLAKRLS
ncbi:MAG TPA: hypothetical protein VN086_03105 [Candidatus Paceibacterota bacterium]|nr:hypothetical protein [Candidatus Paceibacterota bacterium]